MRFFKRKLIDKIGNRKSDDSGAFAEFAAVMIMLIVIFLLLMKSCDAQFTAKSDTGVTYGFGYGLNGLEELKMNVSYATNTTTLHRLQIDVHGGGGGTRFA